MTASLTTLRLSLVPFSTADAAWVLALLNDPGFIQHIGDRGVRTEAEALAYTQNGLFFGMSADGFGLRKMVMRDSGSAVGVCGLLRRAHLEGPDLGYALLAAHVGLGLASEAAQAMLEVAWQVHGLHRVLAIVKPTNHRSIRLLRGLGFVPADRSSAEPSGSDPPLAPVLSLYALERPGLPALHPSPMLPLTHPTRS